MLTVHHLGVSQSERIVWLCEELGLDYNLKLYKRDPMFSPPEYKALHPIGAAPVIEDTDGDVKIAESNACADYIIHRHGNGRLAVPPSAKNYADYLYWYNFANGSLQPGLSRVMMLKFAGVDEQNQVLMMVKGKMDNYLKFLDERLGSSTWLAGDEFTAADVMTVFTLTTMRVFYPLDITAYGNILRWLKKCSEREAYIKAREKSEPGLPLMIDGEPPKSFQELSSK